MVARARRARQLEWAARAAITLALLWTAGLQTAATGRTWRLMAAAPPPSREYESNGYLMVSSNGGLNQMRAGICDMVAVSRYMNATLVIPQLDNTSFWHDQSQFEDIFDVDHFIKSLRDEVKIVKELPSHMQRKISNGKFISMPPGSWSNMPYYTEKILHGCFKYGIRAIFESSSPRSHTGLPLHLAGPKDSPNPRTKPLKYISGSTCGRVLEMYPTLDMQMTSKWLIKSWATPPIPLKF